MRKSSFKETDGREFADTLRIIKSSTHITEYLSAYPEYDIDEQREIMAAQFTPEAAQALVHLLESGEITIAPERGSNGEPTSDVGIHPSGVELGKKQTLQTAAWTGPQCPSAWAALYAWAATEAAFCGALGLVGPGAALACFIVMTGLGSIPDINAGC